MASDGRYVVSHLKNSCVPSFRTPNSKESSERKITGRSTGRDSPGPGSYTPRDTDRTNKYRNSYNLVLYQQDRRIELYDKTKLTLPGPQQYTLPSDFGNLNMVSTKSLAIPQQIGKKHVRKNAQFNRNIDKGVAANTHVISATKLASATETTSKT